MKILNAKVYDPRLMGILERPRICIDIDFDPGVTSDTIMIEVDGDIWTGCSRGPLICYDTTGGKAAAGRFNKVRTGSQPLVDVDVFCMDTEQDVIAGQCAISLQKARALLRKHDPDWRLVMDDYDGQRNLLSWTPVNKDFTCMQSYTATSAVVLCRMPAQGRIHIGETEIPMCKHHIEQHNSKAAKRRVHG